MTDTHKSHPAHWLKELSQRRFFLLFLFLLAALILYPYGESTAFGFYGFRVVVAAGIIFCVYAAGFRKSLIFVAVALAIPSFLHRVLNLAINPNAFSITNTFLSLAFDVLIVTVIFRRVFSAGQPNSETILGALCIYLLIGFGFASIFEMLSLVQTNAFYLDPVANLHEHPDRLDCIYYSFATLSSVGANGITPVTGEARNLSVIEAILGVLYLAVLISRLVAAYRHPSSS